jgi:hypothetical protein
VADAVGKAYRSNRRLIVVPWSNNLLTGFYRSLPALVNWGMLKMLRKLDRQKES